MGSLHEVLPYVLTSHMLLLLQVFQQCSAAVYSILLNTVQCSDCIRLGFYVQIVKARVTRVLLTISS